MALSPEFTGGELQFSGQSADRFKEMYVKGKGKGKVQPWDIGKPQPALVSLHQERPDLFASPILDVGCGLGNNAIWLGSVGAEVVAVDVSPEALTECKSRLSATGPINGSVDFLECNVLLPDLPEAVASKTPFATIIDSAVFHCIGDGPTRELYVSALHRLLAPGGHLIIHIFSDKNPDPYTGPTRVSEAYLRSFVNVETGWELGELSTVKYQDNVREAGYAWAWLGIAKRLGDSGDVQHDAL